MPDTDEYRRAAAWHGLAVASQSGGESVSAKLRGDWLDATPGLLPQARVTALASMEPRVAVVAALWCASRTVMAVGATALPPQEWFAAQRQQLAGVAQTPG